MKVGVQLQPQRTSVPALRTAAREADAAGIDSVWVWDHFFPILGEPTGAHFEGWTTLAAIAADTERASVGTLVTGNTYRNPDLLADMARTVDHVSGGRAVLGIGAGWFQKDYEEYGYEFGTRGSRLRDLEDSLRRIRARIPRLDPPPVGELPILIGGGGERVTLRLVAEYADAWNGFGDPDEWGRKNRVLDGWCEQVGRDPAAVERTVLIREQEIDRVAGYREAGCDHIILQRSDPFELAPARRLLEAARG